MSSPPPTKPPRGVKQGKETSGLLMSVIRTLSASETNEQREKERAKLEKEYKKSDARLDELVAAHGAELADVMLKFGSDGAGGALAQCSAAEAGARARLAACRHLLRVRRDDLRRLWTDARAHSLALSSLAAIEEVVEAERGVRAAAARGRVLLAAATVARALRAAEPLGNAPALAPAAAQLREARDELARRLRRDLADALLACEAPRADRRGRGGRRRAAALLAELAEGDEPADAERVGADVTPELEAGVPRDERPLDLHLAILLEACAELDALDDVTEGFKVDMQSELLEVVARASRAERAELGDRDAEAEAEAGELGDDERGPPPSEPEARRVWRLMWRLLDEWVACGARLRAAAPVWRAALRRRGGRAAPYTEHRYWSAVQQVMQLVVSEYVDVESAGAAGAAAGAGDAAAGDDCSLSEYFGRRKGARRRTRLFRLATAARPRTPARQSRARRYPLLCAARPELLPAVLPALRELVRHIERQEGGAGGRAKEPECSLRAFVADFVRGGAADALAARTRAAVDAAAAEPRAWRERAAAARRPVLAGARAAWAHVEAAAAWADAAAWWCGGEAGAALLPALRALAAHVERAHAALPPAADASHAARWLADDDIVRFLQALSNWRAATEDGAAPVPPAELTAAYEREAEILGSSLGDAAVRRSDLLAEPAALARHALMCETADWLAESVRALPAAAAELEAAAAAFRRVAHKCLLLLHLELRIQCFYYLGQEAAGASAEEEEAGGAARLAAALLTFHERVAPVLAPRRLSYVLGGLGEMMSAGVVWRWRGGAGGEEWGAEAQLATLRHCLAALALPHEGLARAARYLALLAAAPGDIVAAVRERGAVFSELEYLNAFKLIAARRDVPAAAMRRQLDALAAALAADAARR